MYIVRYHYFGGPCSTLKMGKASSCITSLPFTKSHGITFRQHPACTSAYVKPLRYAEMTLACLRHYNPYIVFTSLSPTHRTSHPFVSSSPCVAIAHHLLHKTYICPFTPTTLSTSLAVHFNPSGSKFTAKSIKSLVSSPTVHTYC
jgi:hypothetical protein